MLKKCEERGEVVEKKDSKQISGDGEEEEFDYEKWVNKQCRKIKQIEEEQLHEKTMQAEVEECDLSLMSLAWPATEHRWFQCKVSANRAHTQWADEICLALTKTCDKNCLCQIFNFLIVGALESNKIFVDHKESIKW